MPWPEPVERVAVFLRAAGAEARLEEFAANTPTAQAAAEAIGCALDQIVKSIVLVCGTQPVVALVPGNRRADAVKVALAAGADHARVARPPEVVAATGFAPGAVAPFPPPAGVLILVERTILSSPVVWVGAGSERHMAMLSPLELVRLTCGNTVDIVQESA
jgi:prolyl-tRNA editing enzyme YbaK/EbsC (Cys-tRNA(Pro) deacylase)